MRGGGSFFPHPRFLISRPNVESATQIGFHARRGLELVWQGSSFVEWRFVENRKVDVALKNATTSRSHGSLHTMILYTYKIYTWYIYIYVRDTARLVCTLCRRGVLLKSAPCSCSISSCRCWKIVRECDLTVQFFPSFGHTGTPSSRRRHAERATCNSSGVDLRGKLAVVLIQHIGQFGGVSLDERADFLSVPCTRCT